MRGLTAVALLCLALAPDAPAAGRRCGDDVDGRPVPCACGDVLVSSRTLGADDPITREICPGLGLLVAVADDHHPATLDLGGHTLSGSGRGVGIQVVSGGAGGLTLVGPGTVRGFGAGLTARGGVAVVRDVLALENRADGFQLAGEGYAITGCEAVRNGRSGFVLAGRAFHADGNRARENARIGIRVMGRDARLGGALGNEAAGNRRGGLAVRGRGLTVSRSVASGNGGPGLQAVGDLEMQDTTSRGNAGGGLELRGARVRISGAQSDTCRGAACP